MPADVQHQDVVEPLRSQLRGSLLSAHGPLLSGEALATAMGFRSQASLRQARLRGQLGVPLFTVPCRRGWFALTQDVADWLAEMRSRGRPNGG